MGQVGFDRTVPLVLHGTVLWNPICPTCPTWDSPMESYLSHQRKSILCVHPIPLVLHGTGGIGRTHRIEGVGGTGRIP